MPPSKSSSLDAPKKIWKGLMNPLGHVSANVSEGFKVNFFLLFLHELEKKRKVLFFNIVLELSKIIQRTTKLVRTSSSLSTQIFFSSLPISLNSSSEISIWSDSSNP